MKALVLAPVRFYRFFVSPLLGVNCRYEPGCASYAEEAVKRRLVPKVGRETIRILLLHHDLKPWREKNVVVRRDKPAWS